MDSKTKQGRVRYEPIEIKIFKWLTFFYDSSHVSLNEEMHMYDSARMGAR